MMSIMATLPITCRHCGVEIEKRPALVDVLAEWVDVRLSSEGGTDDYCAMGPYASHLPEPGTGGMPA